MRSKLPGHFFSALEIRAPLKGGTLYSAALDLVEFYNLHFEMVLNYPLLIFKHIRDLGLPGKFLDYSIMTSAE
jgi:RNA polymerase I-specific transcription initiation factor RRN7